MTDEAGPLLERFDVVTSEVEIDGDRYLLTHPRDAEALIDEAAFRHDERLPYWADVWPASVALARAVRAMDGSGRTLLELGCGVGLVVAAALRAGFDVTASDYYADALSFERLNGAVRRVAAMPEVASRLADLGVEPVIEDQAAFARHIQAEYARNTQIIAEAGIEPM